MSNTMRFLEPSAAGALAIAERPRPLPGPGEVLIKVRASGVNRADLAQRDGRYPPPLGASDILGLEVAGEIEAVGRGVSDRRPGESVCALLAGGGYAEYCTVPAVQTAPVPEGLDALGAAALIETACTVWDNVFVRAGLQSGETLLVHGGGSGIGVTAIQLARAFGCRVLVTVGSAEKGARCLGLGADCAINYHEEDFVAAVKAVTEGEGADVILDLVGGPYLARNLQALALEGRLTIISVSGGAMGEADLRLMMQRRLRIMASTLRARPAAAKGEVIAAVVHHVWPLVRAGQLLPVIDSVFPVADAEAAHVRMRASLHFGKLLLDWAA